jgi:predicted N-formylglutamate amidohydrolase
MSGTVTRLAPRRPALLGEDDPAPFEIVNGEGRARAVLFCDHASRAVPRALGDLGLDESLLERHIGWAIGAGDVTRRLAAMIDAPAVLAGFSRLVIDCNRPPDSPASIPRVSDGVAIAGNADVDEAAAQARLHGFDGDALLPRDLGRRVLVEVALDDRRPVGLLECMDGFGHALL